NNLESLDLKNQHSLVNLEAQNNNLKKLIFLIVIN
ncbi:leucine-rich repeat domain-containing protein, partial [Escherichia coli]|nr:leucine-rich repeat domain-containing protein [Escherichia coli]